MARMERDLDQHRSNNSKISSVLPIVPTTRVLLPLVLLDDLHLIVGVLDLVVFSKLTLCRTTYT